MHVQKGTAERAKGPRDEQSARRREPLTATSVSSAASPGGAAPFAYTAKMLTMINKTARKNAPAMA